MADQNMTYNQALHAMQSGVKHMMAHDHKETDPKHLRVGVNSALRGVGSLVKLLIEKRVITGEEYYEAIRKGMIEEVEMYEKKISLISGDANITLA